MTAFETELVHAQLLKDYIENHKNLSLEKLDNVVEETRKKHTELIQRVKLYENAEGTDLRVINECIRIPAEKRTVLQQKIVDEQKPQTRMLQNSDILAELNVQVAKTAEYLNEWNTIREKFILMYPQASTSPRLLRQDLQRSPARIIEKSKSASSLTSSPSSTALPSPRSWLRSSGKSLSHSATAITATISAPNIVKKETH